MKTLFRFKNILLIIAILLLCLTAWIGWVAQGSLALRDGEYSAPGLTAPVIITRDGQGIPTITSTDRKATAYGLGFVHAQDRFFQMDLLRRNSAGELSALIGSATLDHDREVRIHRFRALAERSLAAAPPEHLRILEAYAKGVNAGLTQLSSAPFEYHLLGAEPAPWQPADSLLVVFSMYLTLQDDLGETERYDSLMADVLPQDLYEFLYPAGGRWDAPLLGGAFAEVGIPTSGLADLGFAEGGVTNDQPLDDQSLVYQSLAYQPLVYQQLSDSDDHTIGSNNWVVGGALTLSGSAMVADDMHLNIQVPNIWYRASWPVPSNDGDSEQEALTMTGASLPGTPAMVVGSNGKVAWGFTNTSGDWSDVVLLETDDSGENYKVTTAEGQTFEPFQVIDEVIQVRGQADEHLIIKETRWGPVIGKDHKGQEMALHWMAHEEQGASLNLIGMESVTNVADAMKIASTFGQPAQNLVAGDDQGNIGWTVAAPIPKRFGLKGNRPQSWANGDKGWDGYVSYADAPKIYNPESHRIWTANARTMDGEYLALMGDGGYAIGARQQQIRDSLFAKDQFTEQDLLDIQLDDRAIFLQRWHDHLTTLIENSNENTSLLQSKDALLAVLKSWGARASADSVGYRLVRNFRYKVIEYSFAPFATVLTQADPSFQIDFVKRSIEYPVWSMVTEQPQHLLNPDFDSWTALEIAALNDVLKTMAADGLPLEQQTWGVENTANIIHPLVKAVPALRPFLSMPAEPLSGDTHMPRVQKSDNGASERMVVSPGHEKSGIFHMATGQSGHPLSKWFDDGHKDWVEGNPSPFLPADTQSELRLIPKE